ncbi:MAG: hypothetical protein Q8O76_04615 [Chloroflexota bacterium]|nr:hypothetical protein [Chloroflexota bacterium]
MECSTAAQIRSRITEAAILRHSKEWISDEALAGHRLSAGSGWLHRCVVAGSSPNVHLSDRLSRVLSRVLSHPFAALRAGPFAGAWHSSARRLPQPIAPDRGDGVGATFAHRQP